jgi:hypothetical protein
MIVTLAIVAFASITNAQSPLPIEITYDDAGNRITRKVLQMSMMSKGESQADTTYYLDRMQTTEMKVYPNPTQGKILVDFMDAEGNNAILVRIYDNKGQKIQECQGKESQMELDLSNYPAGVYIVELFVGEEHTTWRILKK